MNKKTKKSMSEEEIDAECRKEAEKFISGIVDDIKIYIFVVW